MKVYTAITLAELEILKKDGRLVCNPRHKNFFANKASFRFAYQWMANKLREKDPSKIQYPRWVYFKIHGNTDINIAKDLDLPYTKNICYLKLEINENRVLLSDVNLWELVLNLFYIPDNILSSPNNFNNFMDKNKTSHKFILDKKINNPIYREMKNEIINSWDKIFDINKNNSSKYLSKTIQGVLWEIKKEDVIDYTIDL